MNINFELPETKRTMEIRDINTPEDYCDIRYLDPQERSWIVNNAPIHIHKPILSDDIYQASKTGVIANGECFELSILKENNVYVLTICYRDNADREVWYCKTKLLTNEDLKVADCFVDTCRAFEEKDIKRNIAPDLQLFPIYTTSLKQENRAIYIPNMIIRVNMREECTHFTIDNTEVEEVEC